MKMVENMTISKQKQLVIRIQTDLKKEAARHRGDNNKVAADDCVDQAEDLKEVLESLTTLEEIYSVAKRIRCNWRKGH
jgi:ATP-dependent helicase/DNAse subunit B